MTDATPMPDQSLHLPSLVIKNFRGIDELTIPRLGRVTLLAGKNGVGKTTVLDAVRVWAYRGGAGVLDQVLQERGDSYTLIEGNQSRVIVDRMALFTGRRTDQEIVIYTTSTDGSTGVQICELSHDAESVGKYGSFFENVSGNLRLDVQFGSFTPPTTGGIRFTADRILNIVAYNALGPNGPDDAKVEEYWTDMALTSHEDRALEALNLITGVEVERVAALGLPISSGIIQPRRMMARVASMDYQVPLRALGDGAMRIYAVALALAASSGGFLLIDEVENGIHHSVQPKFWKMVLQTAQRNNVQVLATTHSWDCVRGFAQAANESEDVEGVLVRLERVPAGLKAITYDESRLEIAARSNIEVR